MKDNSEAVIPFDMSLRGRLRRRWTRAKRRRQIKRQPQITVHMHVTDNYSEALRRAVNAERRLW